MSWDAVILRVRNSAWPIGDVADQEYLPLGTPESVAAAVREAFPSAEWSNPTYAHYLLDKYTAVMIDLKHVESSQSIHVTVSGSGNPIPDLLSLANPNGWVVLDCSTTAFVDPNGQTSEGVSGYHSLLRSIPVSGPGEG